VDASNNGAAHLSSYRRRFNRTRNVHQPVYDLYFSLFSVCRDFFKLANIWRDAVCFACHVMHASVVVAAEVTNPVLPKEKSSYIDMDSGKEANV
jgi:hypothetical protein